MGPKRRGTKATSLDEEDDDGSDEDVEELKP
jgi:hypothetical protein